MQYSHLAFEQTDQRSHDVQADAGSFLSAFKFAAASIKNFEDAVAQVRSDSLTVVDDLCDDPAVFRQSDMHVGAVVFRRT